MGGSIFGTDGVRDRVGEGYLEASQVERISAAIALALGRRERFPDDFPDDRRSESARSVVIGRDTRESGLELTRILARGLAAAGHRVVDVGVIPTPGVSRLILSRAEACLGLMVSASHNPAEYNGIKLLAPTGAKASDLFELEVSRAFRSGESVAGRGESGDTLEEPEAVDAYVDFLVQACHRSEALAGRAIVLDTAHGATVDVAPRVFGRLGARVIRIGDAPDGGNINEGCGALHPEGLRDRVLGETAWCGFAFDGDGDRMIPVTGAGEILDGDYILAILARYLRETGRLPHRTVVATVMSNIGLEKSLADESLLLARTPVGDRNVYAEMVAGDHPLGGEQSGHIILSHDAPTGDGVLAAIRLVDALAHAALSMEQAARMMTRYPQVLINYEVARKVALEDLEDVRNAITDAETALAGDGRVVVRYSGTEPLARVMVEGPDADSIEALARDIGERIVRATAASTHPVGVTEAGDA